VESHYGLALTPEGVRNLAQECRNQNKISAELTQKIHALLAYASTPGTGDYRNAGESGGQST
jgi:hypothetical protein